MNKKDFSIGTTYQGTNSAFLKAVKPYVSHIEFLPGSISRSSFENYVSKQVIDDLLSMADDADILVHGSELSIGSYDGYSQSYIKQLENLFYFLPVKWHSEHLAYTMVSGENSGAMLTLPKTDEALEIICQRIDAIHKKLKIPFLLENVARLLPAAECKYSDAAFLNKVSQLTGCGLIVDIHNLECDAQNFNLSIYDFMDELNTDSIYEVHLTGMLTENNLLTGINLSYEEPFTLQLLHSLLSRSPKNLAAVTYEINESVARAGTTNIIKQLVLLNQILNKPNGAFNTIENQFIIPDQIPVN